MKNINMGIVSLIVSNKLKDSYFNNNLIMESKKITSDFFDVIKNSPILQLEFNVFNKLENKHIENDSMATRYIDNNIKLFEIYSIEEIDAEHKKLNIFISEDVIPSDNERVELYTAINNLIRESLTNYDDIDVDDIHESFTLILNHIKSPKKTLLENLDINSVNNDVIEIAVEKFNKKYDGLNEDDKNLLKKLIKITDKEKEILLETYKDESLVILKLINKESAKTNVEKASKKINEMIYDKKDVDDNIIGLHELKKELL